MKPSDYLDELKKKQGVESDYALHKVLGITRGAVSQFRHNKHWFSDEMSVQVAEILDINPAKILIDMHIMRSQSKPQLLAAWTGLSEKLSTGLHQSFNLIMTLAAPRGDSLSS
jgi:plasmid maintenance system antidote protein VapI